MDQCKEAPRSIEAELRRIDRRVRDEACSPTYSDGLLLLDQLRFVERERNSALEMLEREREYITTLRSENAELHRQVRARQPSMVHMTEGGVYVDGKRVEPVRPIVRGDAEDPTPVLAETNRLLARMLAAKLDVE